MMDATPLRQAATLLSALVLVLPDATRAKDEQTDVTSDMYRYNKGPLTTTFTPPSTCLAEQRTVYPWQGAYPNLMIGCQGPGGNECCPDEWGTNRYFSPGVCPSGYFGCTLPSTRQRDETTNLCCPSSFDCPTQVGWPICRSSLNTWRTAEYTDKDGVTSLATFLAVEATPIQIRFRQTDADVVPIPTGSFHLPPPLTEEELAELERGKGLSTGVKAGIGVGVALGVIVVVGALTWFLRKKAQAKRRGRAEESFMLPEQPVPAQTADDEPPPPYSKR